MCPDLDRGAYGFRLVSGDVDLVLPRLIEVPAHAPEVTVRWRQGSSTANGDVVLEDRVIFAAHRLGLLDIHLDPASILGVHPDAHSPDAIVHPMLTLPLAVLAHLRGAIVLHGGAFAHGGRAWVVIGAQMAGKSSVLAGLVAAGAPVLADDLVVILDGVLLAGPNCIDLRPDVAERFPGARSLGTVGGRPRFRFDTPPSPERLPLGGIVALGWHDEPSSVLEPMAADAQLSLLYANNYAGWVDAPEPERMLALLDVPAWTLRRDRNWDRADRVIADLLGLAG